LGLNRKTFLAFSAELTGYREVDLEGTGLVDAYLGLVDEQVGEVCANLEEVAARVVRKAPGAPRQDEMRVQVLASAVYWPVARALITLWYLGSWPYLPLSWYVTSGWPALPTGLPKTPKHWTAGGSLVPSAEAYTQQLAYRAAGAHPPGASPTGFGSWSIPPVFGDPDAGNESAS